MAIREVGTVIVMYVLAYPIYGVYILINDFVSVLLFVHVSIYIMV